MINSEIDKLTAHLQERLNPGISLRRRGGKDDSVEVYIGDEFLGVLFKDDEDPSDISYNLDIAILSIDLE